MSLELDSQSRPRLSPGPEERKFKNWLRWKITGKWPPEVLAERLRISDELFGYCTACGGPCRDEGDE